jgi:hypothetical protein
LAQTGAAAGPRDQRSLEPKRVEHLQFGITWDVTEILDHWEHPKHAKDTLGKAILIKWWLLRVSGPLPGRPAERGEFVMEVSFRSDPPGNPSETSGTGRGAYSSPSQCGQEPRFVPLTGSDRPGLSPASCSGLTITTTGGLAFPAARLQAHWFSGWSQ